jgi:hypothetical protein
MVATKEKAAQEARRPTAPDQIPLARFKRGRTGRRVAVAVLVLFLLVTLSSFLGSQTGTSTATGGGYTLTVTYPKVTRPGLPIRWEFTVSHPGGFDQPIHLATSFDELHLFDTSNVEPDAKSSTATATDVIYTFAPPSGDTLRVSMDGNTEPDFHEFGPATTSVLIDGQPAVSVSYRTVVIP